MKEFVQHPIYGEIVYNESFLTGKKTLTINGVDAQPVSKNEFTVEGKKVVIVGSHLVGIKILINNVAIEVSPKPKWYEIVFAVLPLIFLLTWGNSVALCSIFPVVGGAIGGALGGIGSITSLFLMKNAKSLIAKLLIGIGAFVVTVLIAFALALLIITLIA
ncbi:MAG: hypothetical protein IKC38_02335 [Clostridia bacterium]|nr:hypothetical protein [Clostridia bacterium]